MHQYQCACGYTFPEPLGKYGCPNCAGTEVAQLVPVSSIRFAVVPVTTPRAVVTRYLPGNYRVIGWTQLARTTCWLLVGTDVQEVTLTGYVLPRLQQALIAAREVTLLELDPNG